MRHLLAIVSLVVGSLVGGCDAGMPTGSAAAPDAERPSLELLGAPSCELALHAILREAGTIEVVGTIQLRIRPAVESGEEPTVQYWGRFGSDPGLGYAFLSARLLPRLPDQPPVWSDFGKSDPGTPLATLLFSRIATMSPAVALALVDDPTRFKAVLNVVGATGGREAEGVVEPVTTVPESLRERQRLCFRT